MWIVLKFHTQQKCYAEVEKRNLKSFQLSMQLNNLLIMLYVPSF